MFNKKIEKKLDDINNKINKSIILELSYLIGNKREILKRNLIAGIARGIGIGIGVTMITAIILYLLRKLVLLNLPIIGDYIGDLIEIVEKTK